jgi:CheY-like chemotaxis protein
MRTSVDRLDRFLTGHRNEVIVALALVVLAEAAIIWLWARRAATLRRRLDAAEQAAGTAASAAAAALAVDALRPSERELDTATEPLDDAPAATLLPAAPLLAPPSLPVSAPLAASASPVDTAAALRAAAEASEPQAAAAEGVAGWAVEAAAQLPPAAVEVRPAEGLGVLAAWTETRPLDEAAAAWSWASPAATPAAAAPVAPAADAERGPSEHLLLVEDDVNVAKLYRMLLESRGYIVRHAADGIEGLDAARQERPDLILLDVMMPRMNGITFLQALREDATLAAVPAVVLSNFREPRLVERAMALGALEYMVKAQTRPETLVSAIPHWLKGERVVTA